MLLLIKIYKLGEISNGRNINLKPTELNSGSAMKCTLCDGETVDFHLWEKRKFVRCKNCRAIFLHPNSYLNSIEERGHYLLHNNDVTDPRYKKFLSPITTRIRKEFSDNSKGLDLAVGQGLLLPLS